jgi:hypothetical protein
MFHVRNKLSPGSEFVCESEHGVLFTRATQRQLLWYDATCTRLMRVFALETPALSACFVQFKGNHDHDHNVDKNGPRNWKTDRNPHSHGPNGNSIPASVAVLLSRQHVRIYSLHSNTIDLPVSFPVEKLWAVPDCLLLERSFAENAVYSEYTDEMFQAYALFDPLGSIIPIQMFDSAHRWNMGETGFPPTSISPTAASSVQFFGEKLQDSSFTMSDMNRIVAVSGSIVVVHNLSTTLVYMFMMKWRKTHKPLQPPANMVPNASPLGTGRSPMGSNRESPLIFSGRDRTGSGASLPGLAVPAGGSHNRCPSPYNQPYLHSAAANALKMSPSPTSTPMAVHLPLKNIGTASTNSNSSIYRVSPRQRSDEFAGMQMSQSLQAGSQNGSGVAEVLSCQYDCGLFKLCEVDDFIEIELDSGVTTPAQVSFSRSTWRPEHLVLHVVLGPGGRYQCYEVGISEEDSVKGTLTKLPVHQDIAASVSSICHVTMQIGGNELSRLRREEIAVPAVGASLVMMKNGTIVLVAGNIPVLSLPLQVSDDLDTSGQPRLDLSGPECALRTVALGSSACFLLNVSGFSQV